jgi:asparagine synthetase B (glutamine-hydrolysing)
MPHEYRNGTKVTYVITFFGWKSSLHHHLIQQSNRHDGYGRHRTAWNRGGEASLRRKLTADQERLWHRNCGRDDRILSDLGKEVRCPYLDVSVRHFLQSAVPLNGCVCDFRLPPGRGDKRLLRTSD